jgi:hypothetical protein
MLKVKLAILSILYSIISFAQVGNPDLLQITEVRASETDANISFELAKHFVFYNLTAQEFTVGSLLVYLPGSFDSPENTLLFPSYAANLGFHVVNLKYQNNVAAKTACQNSTDSNCFPNFREEIIHGTAMSDKVDVDSTNSIVNRILKLIIHLNDENPDNGWDQYLNNGSLAWTKIIVSGHSQGGGHAAYMGLSKSLKRVLMFASPNDWSKHFNAPAK